jgi:hypothetical protein
MASQSPHAAAQANVDALLETHVRAALRQAVASRAPGACQPRRQRAAYRASRAQRANNPALALAPLTLALQQAKEIEALGAALGSSRPEYWDDIWSLRFVLSFAEPAKRGAPRCRADNGPSVLWHTRATARLHSRV